MRGLRRRRRLLGLTQQSLAEAVGLRFQQIQKYECGANRVTASRLWQLARALNVPATYFFEGLPDSIAAAHAGETEGANLPSDVMAQSETIELVRAYYQLGERPRRKLLDLAKSLREEGLSIRGAKRLITADRGLAGSYNTLVLRKAWDFLRETVGESSLFSVGKKGSQFFSKRGYNVVESMSVPTSGARLQDAMDITAKAREMFESGEVDAIYLCYSKFYSPIRQVPQVVQILPIEPPTAAEGEVTTGGSKEYDFEPDPTDLLALLLPKYLLTVIWQALLESAASEHGARMTAMSNATDNAGKMIGELTLTANRARQAGITKEILEIVGGAEALKN